MSSQKKDVHNLLKEAERAGCDIRRGGDGHWKVSCPGGAHMSVPDTPSDPRTVANFKAKLRRAGVLQRK